MLIIERLSRRVYFPGLLLIGLSFHRKNRPTINSSGCIYVDAFIVHPAHAILNIMYGLELSGKSGREVIVLLDPSASTIKLICRIAGLRYVAISGSLSGNNSIDVPKIEDWKSLSFREVVYGDLLHEYLIRSRVYHSLDWSIFNQYRASAEALVSKYLNLGVSRDDIVVQSHVCYPRFGLLQRVALSAGAKVKFQEARNKGIRRTDYVGGHFYGTGHFYFEKSVGVRRENLDRNSRSIIYMHVLEDSPLTNFEPMLFDDYYDWINITLNLISKDDKLKNRTWIIRNHPLNKFYFNTDIIGALVEKYSSVIPKLSNNDKLTYEDVDHVVTCRGSVGLEAAIKGIPISVGASSWYSEKNNWFEIPASLEDYKRNLLEPIVFSEKDRAELNSAYVSYLSDRGEKSLDISIWKMNWNE